MQAFVTVDEARLKTLKLNTINKEFGDTYWTIDDLLMSYLSDGEQREEVITFINKYIDVAKKTFKKAKFVFEIESCYCDSYRLRSYRTLVKNSNEKSPQGMFSIAFDVASVLYLRRNRNKAMLDLSTFALLHRRDDFIDWYDSASLTTTDFDERVYAMVKYISGTNKHNDMLTQIQSNSILLSLVLPQLDASLVDMHRAIYNAMLNEDDVEFARLMDL